MRKISLQHHFETCTQFIFSEGFPYQLPPGMKGGKQITVLRTRQKKLPYQFHPQKPALSRLSMAGVLRAL
jgi:hypothetical protein